MRRSYTEHQAASNHSCEGRCAMKPLKSAKVTQLLERYGYQQDGTGSKVELRRLELAIPRSEKRGPR